MIPTDLALLPPDAAAVYSEIRHLHRVQLTEDHVDLAGQLLEHGLGYAGDLQAGKWFWPTRIHEHATVVNGHSDWAGDMYAEVSVCDPDGCSCGPIMWFHCGHRLASLLGAHIQLADDKRTARVVVDAKECCVLDDTALHPRVAEIALDDVTIDQVAGQFTRLVGDLREARWYVRGESSAAGSVCESEECSHGYEGVHIALPFHPPPRPELGILRGARIAVTTVSLAMVDDRGRRPLERGLGGTLPREWRGPDLE